MVFGGPRQGLPDGGEIFRVFDLYQVEQVRQVCAELFRCALALLLLADGLVF